jgi:hypothetical protein
VAQAALEKAGAGGGVQAALALLLGGHGGLLGGSPQQVGPWMSFSQRQQALDQLNPTPGMFLEVATADATGNVNGLALLQVVSVFSMVQTGVLCEVKFGGASSFARGVALDSAYPGANSGRPLGILHIRRCLP